MQSELETVLDVVRNERNLTLVSSSNSKRADLIHEAFSFLREQEKDAISYVNYKRPTLLMGQIYT